jgi:type I restriction enzyme, S subunit
MWREAPLSELAEISSGGTPSRDVPQFWGGDIPWVTPTDISTCSTNLLRNTKEKISAKGLLASSAKLIPEGSILLTSRATIGEARIAAMPVCTNQGFKNLTPKQNVDGGFLFYQVQRCRGLFERYAAGSTFPEINKADTGRVGILHPFDISQQRRIAAILTSLDTAIEKTEALIEKHQQIKAGLMHDLFNRGVLPNGQLRPPRELAPELYRQTSIGWVPTNWVASKIDTIADVVDPNPSHRNPTYHDEGFPFISTVEFLDNDEVETNTPRRVIAEIVEEQEARCRFASTSIGFSRKGTIGEIRFLPSGLRFALLDSLCVINPKQVHAAFLFAALRSEIVERQIKSVTMGQALQQVSIGRVRDLVIPLAPEPEQVLIGLRLEDSAKAIRTQTAHLRNWRGVKRGLLQDLLTGKVPVKIADTTAVPA